MSGVAWLAPIVLPATAAVLALVAGRARWALALIAPLPALLLALMGPPAPPPDLAWLLLDLRLGLDATGRLLLMTTAGVWLAGGLAARRLLAAPGPAALWLVTLAGNVGVVLAADVVSLYVLYAVMTFAAYGLVVHERTPAAWRAGRVYIVMAVAGEALLLSGLMLAAATTGTVATAELAAGLPAATHADVTIGLLVAGFAVKAGIVPLHVWLPLAHPAAPVPASAVLSGAMIKAGLVGWLAVLPLGAGGVAGWGGALVGAGLATAAAGVAIGLTQTAPKVVLAYSSVSQMGFIATLLGVGLLAPSAAGVAAGAAGVYALHHGLAKAALFLGVGLHGQPGGHRRHRLVLGGTVLAGLVLAGAPLTSGWIAKEVMKDAVGALASPWPQRLTLALALLAAGTAALLTRLVVLLGGWSRAADEPGGHPATGRRATDRGMLVAWVGLLAAGALTVWPLAARLGPTVPAPGLTPASLWAASWPVLAGVGGAVTATVVRRQRRSVSAPDRPMVPPGDLVVPLEAAVRALRRPVRAAAATLTAPSTLVTRIVDRLQRDLRPAAVFDRLDRATTRWSVAGALFGLLAVALALALR